MSIQLVARRREGIGVKGYIQNVQYATRSTEKQLSRTPATIDPDLAENELVIIRLSHDLYN